ncbi:MAG: ClpXP protease specificity-enhancing factor [Sideroxydans sp.]|nr:ClpXP protease specificity-enhancing factor [Sideroxydans sp.]
MPSTKPYLIRAIYDWCTDNALTPYLAVRVDARTQVPMAYVKDGEIVLNLSMEAVRNLQLGNDEITCGGRFGGVPQEIVVPVAAVIGIFAKENGQGLVFQAEESEAPPPDDGPEDGGAPPPGKPRLRVVK